VTLPVTNIASVVFMLVRSGKEVDESVMEGDMDFWGNQKTSLNRESGPRAIRV